MSKYNVKPRCCKDGSLDMRFRENRDKDKFGDPKKSFDSKKLKELEMKIAEQQK
jgi:hypothetical protein